MILPIGIINRLSTGGVTARYVAEVCGIGTREAARLLKDAGAVYGHGKVWAIPGTRRITKGIT